VEIVGVGEMGIGNTPTSAAVISGLTGAEPAKVTGFGGGITEQAYIRKVQCVQRAIEVNKPDADAPLDVLAKVGGFDLAAMCGVFLGCAKYGIPTVIDGVISAAAALCAVRMCPACMDYLFPSHQSVEPGYTAAMKALGMEPWFKLDMRLGEGSGCTMSFAVMEAACAILDRMATFEKAGIDDGYLEEIRELEKKELE
jgi:nicotinate-nucleotide--dimethylbenzimidazole phosphoribosyltransferase